MNPAGRKLCPTNEFLIQLPNGRGKNMPSFSKKMSEAEIDPRVLLVRACEALSNAKQWFAVMQTVILLW